MAQYIIKFKERTTFERITDWIDITDKSWGVDDIGYSDMAIIFCDEEHAKDVENCMIMNHIKSNEYEIYKRELKIERWG